MPGNICNSAVEWIAISPPSTNKSLFDWILISIPIIISFASFFIAYRQYSINRLNLRITKYSKMMDAYSVIHKCFLKNIDVIPAERNLDEASSSLGLLSILCGPESDIVERAEQILLKIKSFSDEEYKSISKNLVRLEDVINKNSPFKNI